MAVKMQHVMLINRRSGAQNENNFLEKQSEDLYKKQFGTVA